MSLFETGQLPQTNLTPKSYRVALEDLELMADIGFHDFEIGHCRRLLISVILQLDMRCWPKTDSKEDSWNYDFIRTEIIQLVTGRRLNLQEKLAEEIFHMLASRPGVLSLSVTLKKPDVYPDAKAVAVTLSSEG